MERERERESVNIKPSVRPRESSHYRPHGHGVDVLGPPDSPLTTHLSDEGLGTGPLGPRRAAPGPVERREREERINETITAAFVISHLMLREGIFLSVVNYCHMATPPFLPLKMTENGGEGMKINSARGV